MTGSMSEEPKSSDVPVSKEASPQDAQIAEPEEELPKASVANYWRVLSFGGRIEHVLLTVALITAAASGVTLPLMNIVFGSLVGNFNSYSANPEDIASEEEAFKKSNAQHALYFVYLFIGKFVLTYLGMFCFRIGGLRISAALRLSYLRALFAQPIRELDQMSTGQVATTITTAANTIQASIGDRLSSFFQSIALVIAAYAIAFKYSWALTLVVSSAILFVLVALSITVPFVLKAMQRVDKADEKHATVSSETLSSIRTVFALGAEDAMTKKHSHWVDQSHRHALKLSKWLAGQLAPFMFATYASYALAFWFGLKLYREGHISSVENVIVVFFSVLLVTTVIGQIASPLVYIGKAISSSTAFFKIIDSNKMSNSGLKAPEVSARDDIVFDNVTFAYPTRSESCVLDAFIANFKKGKTTAIVGPSGSGKSTIVALLERWYSLAEDVPYVSGSITVDSHNIEDFQLSWWRGEIGLVQQEPFLFHDTIARNVAYGLIGTQWESADETTKLQLVKEACVEAFADEFISKLPDGYDTHVGEGGIKLSGGQRQRIAIARSIVRKPSILVLDEATSAIDVRGEKIVQQALDRAAKDRTTIVIAHRLSTIRKADHIIVLRGGRKFEEGTHEELLAIPDGLYQGLVNAQTIEEEHSTHPDGEPLLEYEDAKLVRTRSEKHGQDLAACKVAEIVKSPTSNASFFRSMKRVMATQKSRWYYLPIVLIPAMVCGAANALQSWYFAQLVQTFTYTGQRLVAAANFWALMFFVLALVVMTSNVVLAYGSGRVSAHLGRHWRTSYFRSTLKMPVSYFDELENASGSVMQRLSSDPKQIQDLLGVAGAFPLISIFNIIGSVIISYAFGWKLTLVVFFTVMPVIIGASFLRMRYEVKFEEQNSKIFSESSQFATEAIGAFRTVSSLTMERVIIDKYEELLRAQIQKTTRKSSHGLLFYALTDSVELCGMALAFWYGGELLASGEYNAIQFYVVYSAIVLGAQAAGQYLSITPNLAYSKAAANRMLVVQDQVKGLTMPTADVAPQGTEVGATVTFEDVTFKYASASVPLFSRLNISIDAGQFVAFVGASGCGKTSIISLLERFYEPIRGSIKVDGVDISTVDARSYRQSLALVSQEPRLFSGTARENLVMGLDADSVTPEELEQACRDAEIHEFLTSLPDGYDTELGQSTQTALSGGQKQRLCLARALLRKPHLLLLDEATSSLDSQAERLVQGAIERLAGRRRMTVIAVAHRLATIQKADVIFVFGQRDAEGQSGSSVVEKGTHAELLARRGVYWSMCQAQALDC